MKEGNQKYSKQKFKIYRIMMTIVTLSIVIVSSYTYVTFMQYMSMSNANKLVENAKEVQIGVDSWISDRINVVEIYYGLLSGLTAEDLTYTRTENKYVKFDYAKHKIDALYFGMSDGIFYTGKNWIPDASYDPRVRPWYKGAQHSTSAFIGNTYIDSDTNKTIFTVSKAFRTTDHMKGVIAIDIFMETVAAQLKQLISGTDFEAAIIDEQGIVLHYTGDAYMTSQPIESFQSNKVYLLYQQYKSQKTDEQLLEVENNHLVMIDAISRTPWTLMVFTNEENILNAAEDSLQQFYLLFALIIVLALSGFLLFERTLRAVNRFEYVQEAARPEIDPLTKVFSRSYFDEKLESFWEIGTKQKQSLAIVLIDVDHYRKFAKDYGQSEADHLLVRISREILKNIDPRYVLARYGGNVFAVICYQADRDSVSQVAQQVVEIVASMEIMHQNTEENKVTVSVGAAFTIPSEAMSIGQFIHMGFAALMEAKQAGRNTFRIK